MSYHKHQRTSNAMAYRGCMTNFDEMNAESPRGGFGSNYETNAQAS